ncbi:phage tail protein [Pseudomonas syringae]|uniref:Phage tail protein n=4 Tax=Pseudomonas syringae TaxID=317 RepID=A0AA43IVY4_PSESX|nr:phage tail protein [Pseudomonas syringae]KWS32221.1 phage tail protein [Pseudomonas syringae pv. papulans]MDH4601784.1 phage tail protein [Pseudomonas syringae pv. papulans]MDH4623749.1 phage tail protein [Pseudomonas syringae pv. papulans]
MAASITLAGEKLIAQKQAANLPLTVARFVLANVPGLNVSGPVNRAGLKPPAAQIVYTANITQQGYVNPNQVVYSLLMGTDIGDFDWNWIGMETSDDVLLSVAYVPVQQKRKNILPDQIGNNVTRNFLVVFDGAQQLTGIKIDASTWQFDYTARMKGIDERERISNRDMFGRACFFGAGLQLQKVGNAYQLNPGVGYVEGVRLQLDAVLPVTVPAVPTKAWLDVVLQRELSDVVASFKVVFGQEAKVDYTDSASARHYLVPLADITGTSSLVDLRPIEAIDSELVKHFAARVGDYPELRARATTKDDVGLGKLPNAISDDPNSNSNAVLASTKLVNAVRSALDAVIAAIVDGTTAVGKAARLSTARALKFKGAATGSGTYDGASDTEIALTLADSGVAAGTYTKVNVNLKGLVTSGSNPTTLSGYGITDAYSKDDANSSFVKQGGGPDQKTNRINIGWTGTMLKVSVDGTDMGRIWTETSFNPNDKANKATTLAGYGIADAYTTTQVNDLVGRRVLADSIVHAGFASNNTDYPYFRRISDDKVYYLQPQIGYTPLQQGGGAGQKTNKVFIGWSDVGLKLTVDATDMGRIWTEQSFNPNDKANKANSIAGYGITDCYTAAQVNTLVAARVAADSITTAGFASDNPDYPYFRRASNGAVHYLQNRLGFVPVQQGGGANQATNQLRLGWATNGAGVRAQVDNTDLGLLWGEQNFYRPDNNNFLAVSVTATEVRLPAGGTWCYSLMHYYSGGAGVIGRSGQAAGGTVISFSGGSTIYGFAWRYAA